MPLATACLLPRPSTPFGVRSVCGFVLAVGLMLAVVPLTMPKLAHAVENESEGRRLFKRGQELFVEKRYLEAAQAFETGYAAAPRTAFLINIAHSYRRAGDLEKAKSYYLKLLELEPNTPQRAEVEANIKSIDDALLLKNIPLPPPKPAVPVPDADEAFQRRVAEESLQSQSGKPSDGSEEGDSVFGKAWFWALVLTAAAGAGIATFALTRETGCKEMGCFSEMR